MLINIAESRITFGLSADVKDFVNWQVFLFSFFFPPTF